MKLAFAGKGGVGKTSLTAWLGDYLARRGEKVWLVDADTALSLGRASGLEPHELPEPLINRRDIIEERIRSKTDTMLNLNPEVGDLPEALSVPLPLGAPPLPGAAPGEKRLLVMGAVSGAGGCACDANALLKALLAHLVLERDEWVLVDLEAGVEHLGRGTAMYVDGLVVVSEPSLRALETAAQISRMALDIGLERQVLVFNRSTQQHVTKFAAKSAVLSTDINARIMAMPPLKELEERQLESGSVLGLGKKAQEAVDYFCRNLIAQLEGGK